MSLGVTWVPYAQLHLWYCFHPYFSKHKWRGSWADVFAICFSIWHRFAALPSSSSSRHHCNFSKVEHQLLKHHRKQPRLSKLSSMNPWSSTIIIATNRIAFKQPKNLNLYHKHKPTHIHRFHKGAQSRLIRNWSRIKPNFIQATRSRRLAIGARKPYLSSPQAENSDETFFQIRSKEQQIRWALAKAWPWRKATKGFPKRRLNFISGELNSIAGSTRWLSICSMVEHVQCLRYFGGTDDVKTRLNDWNWSMSDVRISDEDWSCVFWLCC